MSDKIDNIATQIGNASEKIRQRIIETLLKEFNERGTISESLKLITSTSFTESILTEFGLGKELSKAKPIYLDLLNGIQSELGHVNKDIASAFYKIQEGYLYNHVRDVGAELTYALSKGIVSNFTESQMRAELINATKGLANYQIDTLVNTTVRTYGATVKANVFNEFGKDWKYIYSGPSDEKTREVCDETLKMQSAAGS